MHGMMNMRNLARYKLVESCQRMKWNNNINKLHNMGIWTLFFVFSFIHSFLLIILFHFVHIIELCGIRIYNNFFFFIFLSCWWFIHIDFLFSFFSISVVETRWCMISNKYKMWCALDCSLYCVDSVCSVRYTPFYVRYSFLLIFLFLAK